MENVFLALIQNAALLLAMAFIYDVLTSRYRLKHRLTVQVFVGVTLGLLGIIIMLSPWQYVPGIVFDTRSVLLGIAGLFFGAVPTAVAMLMTAAFRLYAGGAAAWVGVGVIFASGLLGVFWKHRQHRHGGELTWWQLYLFGVVVHAVMLAFMLFLPWESALRVLKHITLPVLTIYPLATAMLGMLMVIRRRRDRLSAALSSSEERLRMALKASRQGLYDLNVQTGEIIVNADYALLLGYEPDDFHETNATWIARMHPDDRTPVLAAYREYIAGKTDEFCAEYRQLTFDGEWKWFLSMGKLVEMDSNGHPLRMLGTFSDITERRQADEQSRKAEREKAKLLEEAQQARLTLQRLFEEQKDASAEIERTSRLLAGVLNAASEVSIIATDPQGIITVFNRGAEKMLGFRADEMVGIHTPTAFHLGSELHARYAELNRKEAPPITDIAEFLARVTTGDADHREWTYVRKNGERISVSLVITAMHSPRGETVGYLGIAQDITASKKARSGWRLAQFCIDHAAIGIFRIDENGRILEANRQGCKNLGYLREELNDLSIFDIDPTFTPESWQRHRRDMLTKGSETLESLHRRKDGTVFPVEVTINYFEYEGKTLSYSFVRDITERRQQEDALRKLSQAVEQSPAMVMLTDPAGNIEYVNPKFTRTTGYNPEEVLGKNPRILKSGETSPEEYRKLWEIISAGEEWHGEFHNKRKDGTFFWEHASISPVRDENGAISHFLAIKEDITERKSYEEQLQHLATHDDLTGLANRALLQDRLEQSILFARRSGRLVAALLLDLDRFKIINDSLGHSFGDRLLQIAADRLRESVRGADTVARLGGDEFVILLAEVANEEDVGKVAKKILDRLTAPFIIDDREITVTASLGISIFPRDGEDEETLIRNADIAMYRAKEERNAFCLYTPEMNIVVHEAMEMESDLRRALERGEFLLHYQPKVNLTTGTITGAEALLRWQHPVRGMIAPGMFIPLAEETGLILPIGEWVLKKICEQIKQWQAQNLPVVPIAANLSARQFRNDELGEIIRRILHSSDVSADLLELELTESMIMRNPQSSAETMQRLNDLGVRMALDDFGTGYSSLNYLRRFPVACLKIDRSFICDVAEDPSASAVATSIIAIAHSLGLQAVAEGVETEEQLEFLRRCGCDSYQGYLFCAPLPVEEFTEKLRQNV
jgi:diguanylate cyclase (GGDEF)-like protein/PAS domain S-box-containing protein